MNVRVNLTLGVHRIALEVEQSQESIYRAAGKMLNERLEYYRRTQPQASMEQLWMYVALESAVNLHSDVRDKSLQPVLDKVNELNKLIEEQL